MNPSRAQSARVGISALHNVTDGPPLIGTFLTLSAVRKPNHRPSGEKNGWRAPSVSATALTSSALRSCRKSWVEPPFASPTNATRVPSGETAISAVW